MLISWDKRQHTNGIRVFPHRDVEPDNFITPRVIFTRNHTHLPILLFKNLFQVALMRKQWNLPGENCQWLHKSITLQVTSACDSAMFPSPTHNRQHLEQVIFTRRSCECDHLRGAQARKKPFERKCVRNTLTQHQ